MRNTPILPEAIFSFAARGRRQASAVMSRLALLPESHLNALRQQSFQWLIGLEAASADRTVQAACQDILRRIGMALEGPGREIAAHLLTPEDVTLLRLFRQKVRGMLRGN